MSLTIQNHIYRSDFEHDKCEFNHLTNHKQQAQSLVYHYQLCNNQ